MSLKTRIKNLANEHELGLTALEAKLGFGNGTITKWDKTTPNADKLNAVAQYFGVSMDYLLNGTDQNGLSEKDNRDIAKDLNSLKRKLTNRDDGPVNFDGNNIPDDDLDLFLGQVEIMLRRLKPINKEKYNPNKNKKQVDTFE